MLCGLRNTHWVITNEVLELATNCKSFNIPILAPNHREGGEVTRGVAGQSAITSKEDGVATINLVGDLYILPLCV